VKGFGLHSRTRSRADKLEVTVTGVSDDEDTMLAKNNLARIPRQKGKCRNGKFWRAALPLIK
jgi:hypothetical protein